MRDRRSLDPEQRSTYGASLHPPPGYVFDAAVATTFSMDFETALAVPVSLALFAAESREELLSNPLALLEGVERIAGRLLIFSDAGRIQVSTQPHSRLCSLLERVVVEVAAPGGGAFHPKVWALRFKPRRASDPTRLRLLILSKNLTRDRSWDIAATLDGVITARPRPENQVLANFLDRLPGIATADPPAETHTLVENLADDVRRAEWVLPDEFESVSFATNGFGEAPWEPQPCKRLGIVSPFCDDGVLSVLAELPSAEAPTLIGRSEELAGVSTETLNRFAAVSVLDERTVEEEEEPNATWLEGLHAKAFIAERGWDTSITIGSGNATRPALLSGRNVEIFATLTGKRSQVGSVVEILGEAGFGRMTRPFIPDEVELTDGAEREAEARLDEALAVICRGGLRLRCEKAKESANEGSLYRLWLTPSDPLQLPGIGGLEVWPITRGDGHKCNVLKPLRMGRSADLGSMPLPDLTRFLAFRLKDGSKDLTRLFSTGLAMDGRPANRDEAILQWAIDSKDKFFKYLRLLLSEMGDPIAAAFAVNSGSRGGSWNDAVDDEPLLEDMLRAFCEDRKRLDAVERLITRLETAEEGNSDPIPPEFRKLWAAFRAALEAENRCDAE